uniref:DNA repair protein RadC n=1 Tax=candidate division WOR-3 bacterium TaxID=2052148 RepID=A0A7C3N5G9_UNCW3
MKRFEDYGDLKDTDILKKILKKDYKEEILLKTLEKIYLNFPEISFDILDQLEEEDKNLLFSIFQFYERIKEKEKRIRSPKDVFSLLKDIAKRRQENFIVISLDSSMKIIHKRTVFIGTLNTTFVHPREVFADPIVDRACGIIVAHNHPSSNVEPSSEDDLVTSRLVDAGKILGIEVYDHIILSKDSYYSYKEKKPEFFR